MTRSNFRTLPVCLLLAGLTACVASAQSRGASVPAPAAGGDTVTGGAHPLGGGRGARPPAVTPNETPGGPSQTAGRGLSLGPSGVWWHDGKYAQTLGIDAKQQKRMDVAFAANRDQLYKLYAGLKREEAQLDKVTKTAGVTEAQLDGQIDRVSFARNELQKATTHMMLQVRAELTADQVAKLDTVRTGQ